MTKKERRARIEKFLYNMPHIILDDSIPYEDYLNLDDTGEDFFVYMDAESRGCFENHTHFMNISEVNELVEDQMNRAGKWDHVVIFDINKNKIAKPMVAE